jgi:hypothetical protein
MPRFIPSKAAHIPFYPTLFINISNFKKILISGVILQEHMTIIQMLGGALLLGSTFVSETKFN